jgi:uridine kinase
MISDRTQNLRRILSEWTAVRVRGNPEEPIGTHLCRFHLTADYTPAAAAPLLEKLFYQTALSIHGTQEGLLRRLSLMESLPVSGLTPWLTEYRRRGCPPVHHSEIFRTAYHPHYRVLRMEFARYFPVFYAIQQLISCERPTIIAIDGRCGSGKTGLAARIAELFPCNVLHMDDFFLPVAQRASNWSELPAGNMDLNRLSTEVLLPARAGKPISYRPYNCQTGGFGKALALPVRALTVIEGSYSQHPMLSEYYDLKVFLTCSKSEQMRRLRNREGSYADTFQTLWIPMEERYFRAFGIEQNNPIILRTDDLF